MTNEHPINEQPHIAQIGNKIDLDLASAYRAYPWPNLEASENSLMNLAANPLRQEAADAAQQRALQVVQQHAQAMQTLASQRDAAVIDVILDTAQVSAPLLPDPHDYFCVDFDSQAAGVLRQHWTLAMWEWVESIPEPDQRGIASCTLVPDDHCALPYFIEMKTIPNAFDPEYELVQLNAFHHDGELAGQHAGAAFWMRHLPSYENRWQTNMFSPQAG